MNVYKPPMESAVARFIDWGNIPFFCGYLNFRVLLKIQSSKQDKARTNNCDAAYI